MSDLTWIPVIEESKLKEQSVKLVNPKGLSILLIRKAKDEIYAISNKCAHMACALRTGKLDGYVITCPCHDWRFDIRTGEFMDAREIAIPIYMVKSENGNIYVKL